MSLLPVATALVTGLAVHTFHKARMVTLGNDLADYRNARRAPAVTPPAEEDGGIVLARDVYREADTWRRKYKQATREATRLRQVTYDLYDRLAGGTPRPRHTIPTRTVQPRRGWRDRLRWFTPWPQAAITEPTP